jgi:hypothetical protein
MESEPLLGQCDWWKWLVKDDWQERFGVRQESNGRKRLVD